MKLRMVVALAALFAIAAPRYADARRPILEPVVLDRGPAPARLEGALEARGRMHFGFDSYALDAGDRERVRLVAAVLRHHPNVVVYLFGNTDPRGTADYNHDLSLRRCHAVAAYLDRWGVDWNRIVIVPAGESRPVGSSDKTWALDRRVEMRFVGVAEKEAS